MSVRETADLSQFPGLVVIYLGMKVQSLRGLGTLIAFGLRIEKAVAAKPDGLLLHENLYFGFFPPHAAMRQYWRDLESLERWTHESPHLDWWRSIHKDSQGVAVWHEAYFLRGGIDAVYLSTTAPIGMLKFAPRVPAHGAMSTARSRAQQAGAPAASQPADLYPER
jgi:hypothetical protein